ncbi:MAG: AAA family ATPase [Candidatus Abawacabacteria bacterium]|nr:AAA family ATPase [Candidatus Abawacabacteria bacterium]
MGVFSDQGFEKPNAPRAPSVTPPTVVAPASDGLKLSNVLRSAEPVATNVGNIREITMVGDYSAVVEKVVTPYGQVGSGMRLFDGNGRVPDGSKDRMALCQIRIEEAVQNFDALRSSQSSVGQLLETDRPMTDWQVADKYGQVFSRGGRSLSFATMLAIGFANKANNLPPAFVAQIEELVAKQTRLNVDKVQRDAIKNLGMQIVDGYASVVPFNGEQYLIVRGVNKAGIAFQMTANGAPLPPRDWGKFAPWALANPALPDAEKVVQKFATLPELKPIDDNHCVLVETPMISIRDVTSGNFTTKFSDNMPNVGNNFCLSRDKKRFFYCTSSRPGSVIGVDLTTYQKTEYPLKNNFATVSNLQVDPSGTFFILNAGDNVIVIEIATGEQAAVIPSLSHVHLDQNGKLRAVDKAGYLVTAEPDFATLSAELKVKRAVAQLAIPAAATSAQPAAGLAVAAPRAPQLSQAVQVRLKPSKDALTARFIPEVQAATTLERAEELTAALQIAKKDIVASGSTALETDYIASDVEAALHQKTLLFARARMAAAVVTTRAAIGNFTLVNALALKNELEALAQFRSQVDTVLAQEVSDAYATVEGELVGLYNNTAARIQPDLDAIANEVRKEVDAMINESDLDTWKKLKLPAVRARLRQLETACPSGAAQARGAIANALLIVNNAVRDCQFAMDAKKAEAMRLAEEKKHQARSMVRVDIDDLIAQAKRRQFSDRAALEVFMQGPEGHALTLTIAAVRGHDIHGADELEAHLQAQVAQLAGEIERTAKLQTGTNGAREVRLGNDSFPYYQVPVVAKVTQVRPQFDLVFKMDESSRGNGKSAQDFKGEPELEMTVGASKRRIPLWSMSSEVEQYAGISQYRGQEVPATYMTVKEFAAFKRDAGNWDAVKAEAKRLRDEIHTKYAVGKKRWGVAKSLSVTKNAITAEDGSVLRPAITDAAEIAAYDQWRASCTAAVEAYGKYCAEHHVIQLRQLERLEKSSAPASIGNAEIAENRVPKWQDGWVLDETAEEYLAQMARFFKMQLALGHDFTLLKGHAGTGKDVLIEIFAHLTGRPLFSFNCTKWTDEFALCEDIQLQVEGGASQTIRVPSIIVQGMQTPGAIINLNEFNGMPEHGQLFMHALFDHKRSMTSNAAGGKVIKAAAGVVFTGSANIGYPGTFDIQMATQSRMTEIKVAYPPLQNAAGDYTVSEAWRVARSVPSLKDMSIESDPKRNKFVAHWHKYVNKATPQQTLTPLTPVQQFDLEVILALTQFTDKLRKEFVKSLGKGKPGSKGLPVNLPVTGREMRRCAYLLGQVPDKQKTDKNALNYLNADKLAKQLLEEVFLAHFDDEDDVQKIKAGMNSWTSVRKP